MGVFEEEEEAVDDEEEEEEVGLPVPVPLVCFVFLTTFLHGGASAALLR